LSPDEKIPDWATRGPGTLVQNFEKGMDRLVEPFRYIQGGIKLNLGAGRKNIPGTVRYDADMGWFAPKLAQPDETVTGIYAYHFLEHLERNTLLAMLHEIERVLIPGGWVNIVVPYYTSNMAHQDLDHKSWFTETTFDNLFNCPYYNGTMPRGWKLKVNSCMIMGIVERNLALVVQLVKDY
jgi:hypothetical protein